MTRTTCACPECVACCKRQPGPLIPGDLEQIAAYLHQPVRVAALKFWASPGGLIGNRATGRVMRVPTITPKFRDGRCVFLDKQDRCSIHPVAPFGCSYFDTHMSVEEGTDRALHMMRLQLDPGYQSLRLTLDPATSWRPGDEPDNKAP